MNSLKKIIPILLFIALLGSVFSATNSEEIELVILANKIDWPLAEHFTQALNERGVTSTYVDSLNFTPHKEKDFIVILGGPDTPYGIGELVQVLLNNDENKFLRKQGNKNLYLKRDVWNPNQLVFILAGNTRKETQQIGVEKEWELFNRTLLFIQEEARAAITIEEVGKKYDSTLSSYFLTYVSFSMINTGNKTFDPSVDLRLSKKVSGSYTEIFVDSNISTFERNFKPKDRWIDNVTKSNKLSAGNYKITINLREAESTKILSSDSTEFKV